MKKYLVDGHNLIPNIRGSSLRDIDDEEALIARLEVFARVSRAQVEVFFDRAPAGWSGSAQRGRVKVHFVREGKLADTSIVQRVRQLQKSNPASWTVVSSDRQVQAEVRALKAQVCESAEFAALMEKTRLAEQMKAKTGRQELSEQEVAEWEDLFRSNEFRDS